MHKRLTLRMEVLLINSTPDKIAALNIPGWFSGRSKRNILPGFGLTFGFSVVYLSLILLLPLSMIVLRTLDLSWNQITEVITSPRVLSSFQLSFGTAFIAAVLNAGFGFIVAWVIVRYNFPGKKILDSLVDLPFALPTAVAGISLTAIFAQNGWIGSILYEMGINAVYNRTGIVIALTFIGLPFVVRTIQPILADIDSEIEEAAASLSASRFKTFTKVIFPEVKPALITGFTLAFARALGEYGSVVFISGNMPFKTEIAPLMIMTKLEQYDYAGAIVISVIMLAASFIILLFMNLLQAWKRKYK